MIKKKYLAIFMIILMISTLTSCKVKNNPNSGETTKNSPISDNTSITQSKQPDSIQKTPQSGNSENAVIIAKLFAELDTSKSQFEKGYYDYQGTINGNIPIRMSIYQLDQGIVGTYFYEKEKKEIKLQGKAGDKSIILYEYDESGKNTGIFQGHMVTVDKIEGTWIDPEGIKKFPFTLSLVDSIDGAEYGKRYQGASVGKTDVEVEKFAEEIQNYIVTNNKGKLADLINYPIKVKVKGKIVRIANRDGLIKNYDDIFYPAYKKAISNSFPKYMFLNWRGIMFGENLLNLWFSSDSKSKLIITTINN